MYSMLPSHKRLLTVLLAGLLLLGVLAACMTAAPSNTPTAAPAPTGVAFSWHREGGIAGFCDDVTVDVMGVVVITSCRSEPTVEVARFQLDAAQLDTLSTWVETLQPFQVEQSDLAQADGMTVQLSFTGAGDQVAAEPDQALIVDFAQNLYNEGQMSAIAPPTVCATAGADQQLLIKEEHDYCLLYPAAYSLVQSGPPSIEIVMDTVMNHIDPRASITVEDANGRTLAEVITQLIADSVQPGVAVDQQALTVDGAEAVMLDNLLGQDVYRRVALLHNERLYSFFFAPIGEEGSTTRQQAETLYQTVIDSFRFLTAPNAEPGTEPNPVITPAPLPIPAAADVVTTEVQYILALETVNIRSGPGTNYGIVGSIAAGQVALVTGIMPDSSWWRVICPDDSVGNCFVVNDPTLTQPTTPPGGQPVPPADGTTATYRDDAAGFAFDYHASAWTVGEKQQAGARASLVQLTFGAHTPSETDDTWLDVAVMEWDPKRDLAAYVAVRKAAWTASGMPIVAEETRLLAGDHPAMRFLVTGVDGTSQGFFLITTIGEQYLVLSGSGNLAALEEIAQTLRVQNQ